MIHSAAIRVHCHHGSMHASRSIVLASRVALQLLRTKCPLLPVRLPRLAPVSVTVLARERLAAPTEVTAAVLPIVFRFELPGTRSLASGHGHWPGTGRAAATGCLWQQLLLHCASRAAASRHASVPSGISSPRCKHSGGLSFIGFQKMLAPAESASLDASTTECSQAAAVRPCYDCCARPPAEGCATRLPVATRSCS